jgi:hypothetical protein
VKEIKNPIRDRLIVVGIVFGILASVWGIFTYIGTLARCEDVKAVDQKIDKMINKIDQKIDKSLKTMDYQFKVIQLKAKEDQIYEIERKYGKDPKDPVEKDHLERLKRERDQLLREMKVLEKSE